MEMTIRSLSFTQFQFDTTAPITREPPSTPRPTANADTVAPPDKITLYLSKDTAHKNPLTLQKTEVDVATFKDKHGKEYKYGTINDSPNVFTDRKGRNVYVLDSPEHRRALIDLQEKADRQGEHLADVPLPKYVKYATAAGAILGAEVGSAVAPVVGVVPGAVIGAALLGGSAAGVANLVRHKDQFTLRQKIAVLQDTGVERRAETLRAAVSHSSGMPVALAECLLSTAGDVHEIAENELTRRMEVSAVRAGNDNRSAPIGEKAVSS
ncbi:hypothetical protein [Trinickia symbiotica]|nr:hypothetical protein [Trinickia symbiotica]